MNPTTRERLETINRSFYSATADAFDASRDHPWPGWQRALAHISPGARNEAIRILDAGCGNGRFARFLMRTFPEASAPLDYLGVDQSSALLAAARARISSDEKTRIRWMESDILKSGEGFNLPPGPFDLTVAFGLLHHVPGLENRKAFLAALAQGVGDKGCLVFTAWRFATADRFQGHIKTWEEYNAASPEPVDLQELETGDFLLSFGAGAGPPRYCHHCDDSEFDQLVAATGLELIDDFEADGRSGDLNRYAVLQRSA